MRDPVEADDSTRQTVYMGSHHEGKVPSLPDILMRAAIQASPRFAGSAAILYDGFKRRWNHRAGDVVAEVMSQVTPTLLMNRLDESEELDAAFVSAVDAAARSGMRAKRRLLGAVIAQAVVDDARVDEATLVTGILAQIDTPHVRCLEAIRQAERAAEDAGEILPRARGAEREINQRLVDAGCEHPAPVIVALTSLGLLESCNTTDVPLLLGLTPFGVRLLEELHEYSEEESPPRQTAD